MKIMTTRISAALALCGLIPVMAALASAGRGAGETPGCPPPDSLSRKGLRLVWHDEFNGGRLDTAAWTIETNNNGNGNGELQYYSPRGVSLGTEPTTGARCLILTARRERQGKRQFTSGRIISAGKRTFRHGVIESRIMLPKTADGLWPAFWLLGDNYREVGWPRCGEIDILEMGNTDGIKQSAQERFFNGACHWGYYNEQGQYPNYVAPVTNGSPLQDGKFHTFTLEWDDETIRMYVDRDSNPNALPYYTLGIADKSDQLSPGNYFHHEFFLIYNLAVGGYFTGITDPRHITALPKKHSEARMYVDWVRVYETDNNSY